MKKRIFTFWEPKENLPAYIKLCMQTWTKFLPDYEIIVLDWSNLSDYLSDSAYKNVVFKHMSLAKQSDALRAALIKEHGGIWLDADTIITNPNFLNTVTKSKSDVVMIGRPKTDGVIYGAFIYAAKPNTDFIKDWYAELPGRIRKYRLLVKYPILRKIYKKQWRAAENWDYCVNAIIDDLGKRYHEPAFVCLDRDDIHALPEYESIMAKQISEKDMLYREFWFKNGDVQDILKNTGGIILLHNSWTPPEYRKMDKQTFLSQPILLAKLLQKVLNE